MKIINIFLIIMAIFLAFKPGIELLFMADISEQSCCIDFCSSSHAEEEEEEQKKDDCHDHGCEGNFCNPFQVCGSCFVLIQNQEDKGPSFPAILSTQKFAYLFNASSRFDLEFWHPPELA